MEGLGTGEYNPWNVAFVVFKLLCCVMLNPLLLQTDFFFLTVLHLPTSFMHRYHCGVSMGSV